MKKISISSFLLLFLNIFTAPAQNNNTFEIKGKFTSDQNTKLDEVSIHLFATADKKLVKIEYANQQGSFIFEKIPSGKYFLITQSLAFTKYQSEEIDLGKNTDLGNISLKATSTTLKEVSVTGNKPFVQQQYDKTVLNVASSISAVGSTALEVLEKAPGITVDQNDNIAMRGRQGVLVMIDGKLVPMSGQELANMLRSMSANQIEKIDLISNPSAKYDAAGNSGIIDIRLKKGKNDGTNGNLSMSLGQGVYTKLTPSFNINSKNKNLNIFASYAYNSREDFNDLDIKRTFYTSSDQLTGGNNYDNYFKNIFQNHNARLGADYTVNKDITVGFAANGFFNSGDISSISLAESLNAQLQKSGAFNTFGNNTIKRNNGSVNLNYRQVLDTAGKELTADFDYAKYRSGELQNYNTQYFNLDNTENRPAFLLFGDLNGDLNIKSFKIDYTHPVKSIGTRLEFGIKSSWVSTDNDVKFFNRSNGGNVLDVNKSNQFIYDENISAAYLNANKKWSKLSLQLGLRIENTRAEGLQVINNDSFDRNYTQFFPSGYLGYQFNKSHDLGISLSRRINRPSYRQLNPFKVFLDPLTSSSGNPFLNPEISNSFELTHTFKQKYMTKIGYSRTTDNILQVLSPDSEPNSVIQTGRNLAKYDYFNLSLGVPFTLGKWLSSTNNALVYYGKYSGNLVDTDLNASRVTFNFNSNNSILIDGNTSLEVTGNYQSKSTYGFLDIGSNWSLNVGGQRQLWSKRASIKLNVSDIFLANKTVGFTKLTGYGETFNQIRDTRIGTLSFSYKFGGSQQGSKRKTGGAEEEKRRAG